MKKKYRVVKVVSFDREELAKTEKGPFNWYSTKERYTKETFKSTFNTVPCYHLQQSECTLKTTKVKLMKLICATLENRLPYYSSFQFCYTKW